MDQVITFSASAGAIDAEAGVIRGVSLITKGPALGHGVMIDEKTLEQVKKAAEQYAGGLKVKLDHSGGAGDIVGYIDALRIDGDKLLGDLHLLQSSPHRSYILEIAQRIPDTFGLSIAFSGPSEKSADGLKTLQRCSEIYSVDLVSEPAANPSGFFARKLKQLQEGEVGQDGAKIKMEYPMNDEMKKAIEGMIQSAMMAMGDRVAKLESAIPSEKEEDKPAAMSAQNEAVQLAANAAALAAIKEFSKSFGAPSAPVASAEVSAPAVAAQKFEDVVAAKSVELKGDKSAAIAFSIKNHSDLYVAYRSRVQAGEIIKL
jgi:hypothetical protein